MNDQKVSHANIAFICYSPLHVLIAESLNHSLEFSPCSDVVIYVPYGMKVSLSDRFRIKRYFHAGSESKRLTKLFYLLLNFTVVFPDRRQRVFVSNDASPYAMLIAKRMVYRDLIYIEEGITYLSRLKYKSLNHGSKAGALKKLFGIQNNPIQLSSADIREAYVFFATEVQQIVGHSVKCYDASIYLDRYLLSQKYFFPNEYNEVDCVILTQPMTEDGHCQDFQEISAVRSFIENNLDLQFLLKIHHREDQNKYDSLSEFDNVLIAGSELSCPYQKAHSTLKPRMLVSFISSALFSVPSTSAEFLRVSLVDLIDSERACVYKEGLMDISRYFPDFRFSTELPHMREGLK